MIISYIKGFSPGEGRISPAREEEPPATRRAEVEIAFQLRQKQGAFPSRQFSEAIGRRSRQGCRQAPRRRLGLYASEHDCMIISSDDHSITSFVSIFFCDSGGQSVERVAQMAAQLGEWHEPCC